MQEFQCDPPVPAKRIETPFTQKIVLRDGSRELGRELGRAIWHATSPSEGVIQLLDLWIDPSVRRAGHGGRLLQAVVDQARALHQLQKQPLRRMWVGVGHKTRVVGRSFLTKAGFHHIGSTGGLLLDQDLLVYVKSLD
jgi:GNAT superfamily N-acetyltransferase